MTLLPDALAGAIQSWADFKADHRIVSRLLGASHLVGILLGGGTAITMDRLVSRAARTAAALRPQVLDELERAHRLVVPALVLVFASGFLWTLSELEEFLSKPTYWLKMGMVATLLVNGWLMMRAEAKARTGDESAWGTMRTTSHLSLALWFVILVVGKFL